MPYHIVKEKRGFRVQDDKGNYYSKKPLTKKRAIAQLRALYASYSRGETLRGKGFATYVDEDDNHHTLLQGEGFFSDVWAKIKRVGNTVINKLAPVGNAVASFATAKNLQTASDVLATGIREDYPPDVREVLKKYGNGQVYSLTIYREPIKQYIDTVLNIISLGQWNQAKQRLNYDRMFHLSMVASLSMPNGNKVQVMIEKNEVINITPNFSIGPTAEKIQVPVPCCFTLNDMLLKAQQIQGPKFFKYDAFANNCQMFIMSILSANDLSTPEIAHFVSQNAEAIMKDLPEHVPAFANTLTNLAGFWNRLSKGEGHYHGGKVYCGDKQLPSGYERAGTRNECFKKGVGVGMNIKPAVPTRPLNQLTIRELGQLASKHKISGYSKMKKAELIESLEAINIRGGQEIRPPSPKMKGGYSKAQEALDRDIGALNYEDVKRTDLQNRRGLAQDTNTQYDRQAQLFYSELLRDAKKHPDENPFPKNKYGSLDSKASKVWDKYRRKYPLLDNDTMMLHLVEPPITTYKALTDYWKTRHPEVSEAQATKDTKKEKSSTQLQEQNAPPLNEIPSLQDIGVPLTIDLFTGEPEGLQVPKDYTGWVKEPIVVRWDRGANGKMVPVYRSEAEGYTPDQMWQVKYFEDGKDKSMRVKGLKDARYGNDYGVDALLTKRHDLIPQQIDELMAQAKDGTRPQNADTLFELAKQIQNIKQEQQGRPLTDTEKRQVDNEVFYARYGDNQPINYDENSTENVSFFNTLNNEFGTPGQLVISARQRVDGGYDIEYADGEYESTPPSSRFECNDDNPEVCGLKARAGEYRKIEGQIDQRASQVKSDLEGVANEVNQRRDAEWNNMSGWDKFVNGVSVFGSAVQDYVLPIATTVLDFVPGVGTAVSTGLNIASALADVATSGKCRHFNECTASEIANEQSDYMDKFNEWAGKKEAQAQSQLTHRTIGDQEAQRMSQDAFYKSLTKGSQSHQDLANRIQQHGSYAQSEINELSGTGKAHHLKMAMRRNCVPAPRLPVMREPTMVIEEIEVQPELPTGSGSPVSISRAFRKQLRSVGVAPEKYLHIVREIADDNGYDGRALEYADDDEHKLMIYDDKGTPHRFGRVGYGDFILWSIEEAKGTVPKGFAEQKRRVFTKSHSKIKGNWKDDAYSPNNLALRILW